MATPADAADISVANEQQLRNAISGAAPGDTITFTNSITLTANLPNVTRNVTINGNSFVLSGNDQYRGFFVESGTVAINNLTIVNAKAQGGRGGNANGGGGGGGGAGLGGALFVATGANVALSNVFMQNGQARGGDSGAQIAGCNLVTCPSGGGGGYWPTGANGGNAGIGTGGGGAGGGGDGGYFTASDGGFGGGGGGVTNGSAGGKGGFGGGAGGSAHGTQTATGGFGGGDSTRTADGGGGAGLGGAVFVQEGGALTFNGNLVASGNSVAGGSGGANGGAGKGFGPDIFLQGNGVLSVEPGAGQTQTISAGIVDQTGVGGTGANAGSWEFVKRGAGTTVLAAANAYSGGTSVVGGTLRFATDASLGIAGTGIMLGGGSIGTTIDTPATSMSRNIVLFGSGGIDVAKNPLTWSGSISGQGQLLKFGPGDLTLTGANTYTGGALVSGGLLRFLNDGNLGVAGTSIGLNFGSIGTTVDTPASSMNRELVLFGSGGIDVAKNLLAWTGRISGTGQLVKSGAGELWLNGNNSYSGGTLVTGGVLRVRTADFLGAAGTEITLNGGGIGTIAATPVDTTFNRNVNLIGSGAIDIAQHPTIWSGDIGGSGQLIKRGAGELWLQGTSTYGGGTLVEGGFLRVASDDKLGLEGTGVTLKDNGGLRASESFFSARNFELVGATPLRVGGQFLVDPNKILALTGTISGSTLTKVGQGTLVLTGNNTYSGLNINGGVVQGNTSSLRGPIFFDQNPNNPDAKSVAFNQASDGTFAGGISGPGRLTKTGAGTLILTGNNNYSRGTSVSAGTLEGTTRSLQGDILNNATVAFAMDSDGTYAGNMSGNGALLVKRGGYTLNLDGTNSLGTLTSFLFDLRVNGTTSVGGGTTVELGQLTVNGKLISDVVINKDGGLKGTGNITGNITNNGGNVFPGNSIGHMVVDGNFTFNGGTLGIEINPQGDSDRISVVGADHKVMINAGLLQIIPAAGIYTPNTKYTIITTESGGTVWLGDLAGSVGFLTPEVTLDGGVISVTLALPQNAFRSAGQTINQQAVGGALDTAAASGSVGGLVTTMANLPISQGSAALQALSGQPYADFGTLNTRAGQLFMNSVGRQMAVNRGTFPGGTSSVALAEACDVACDDAAPRFGAWLSAIGSTGNVLGDANAAGLTYTFGGAAFGIDYRLDPRLLVGIAGGYLSGTQWVNGFSGTGYSDNYNVALYASFTQGGFYADALAGYANANNRLQRVINAPGLPSGITNGNTSANQFLGQIETGYQIGLPFPANTSITPFARLQVGAANQAAFTESGGSLYNLAVASQNTTSVRSTFGVDSTAGFDLGGGMPFNVGLRLGWLHEYADTARPMTAGFAAAPVGQFTVYGATPQRDSAVIGLSATAAITDRASLFAAYDGEVGGGTDNHALRVGFRMTW